MVELAFLIFVVVGMSATTKIWKPWIQQKADILHVGVKNSAVDLQEDMHTLSGRIEATKVKHDGKWYTIESIEAQMK